VLDTEAADEETATAQSAAVAEKPVAAESAEDSAEKPEA
jgi:hypothetical protein